MPLLRSERTSSFRDVQRPPGVAVELMARGLRRAATADRLICAGKFVMLGW